MSLSVYSFDITSSLGNLFLWSKDSETATERDITFPLPPRPRNFFLFFEVLLLPCVSAEASIARTLSLLHYYGSIALTIFRTIDQWKPRKRQKYSRHAWSTKKFIFVSKINLILIQILRYIFRNNVKMDRGRIINVRLAKIIAPKYYGIRWH